VPSTESNPARDPRHPTDEKRFIASHCGMRGIAACLVVAYHLQYGAHYLLPVEAATAFFRRSYLLVDLFFILSGFIITFTARPASASFTWPETASFFRHRVARIYPLHIFCLLYIAMALAGFAVLDGLAGKGVTDPHWTGSGLLSLVMEVLLLHAWGVGHAVAWNIPSWSISAEMFSYLLFPVLVAVANTKLWRWSLLVAPLGFFLYIAATSGNLDMIEALAPLRCLAGFMIGMAICRGRGRFRNWPDWVLTTIQLGASGAILALLALPANDVLLILPFALLVATTWTDRGIVARLFSARPIRWLGDLSYSIYLNHVCVIQILWFFWSRTVEKAGILPPDATRIAWIVLVYGATIALSVLTHRYVEGPGRKFLLSRRVARAPIVVSAGSL